MNTVLTFLERNRQRLERHGQSLPERLTSVVITPRFRASSHVVFLVMPEAGPEPCLVAKVPRLPGAGETLEREVANLRAIQASRAGGFDSVPRVVAFERCWERPILVETALVGQPLDPPTVRRDPAGACQAVGDWLATVQLASRSSTREEADWFERLIAGPLASVEKALAPSAAGEKLLERTRQLAERIRAMDLPLVVEHGDLSHPNVMLQRNGKDSGLEVGVVDWELAELKGLPACDLFFFLTYVAFARLRARSSGRHLPAFREAFFGTQSWAHPYVQAYAQRLDLPPETLKPLFVLTWMRYVAGLLARFDSAVPEPGAFDDRTLTWLRNNRYYLLWQHAVAHMDDLEWKPAKGISA